MFLLNLFESSEEKLKMYLQNAIKKISPAQSDLPSNASKERKTHCSGWSPLNKFQNQVQT
jgi:hypothetical protein